MSISDLLVRDAHSNDRETIRELTLAAYQEYAAGMPAHWEQYRENILGTLSETAPAEQLVAEQAGAILGTVLLYPPRRISSARGETVLDMRWPEVRLLAVAPEARRRGIGSALMHECARRARQAGAEVLSLHTTDRMQAAVRMYERMGFRRAAELDFHPAPGVMVKGYCLPLGVA